MISHICTVDHVSVAYFDKGFLNTLGNGHLSVFIDNESNKISLQFIDGTGNVAEVIDLTQQSNLWLQEENLLVLNRPEGGHWRLDCSESDPDAFIAFQDFLTYFIQYENRHRLRNVLALMNPVTCKVTEVVSKNVYLDETRVEATVQTAKRPVIMNENYLKDSASDTSSNMQLTHANSEGSLSGSEWIANTLVTAGHMLAKSISSQYRKNQDTAEPSTALIRLSDSDKSYIESFVSINHAILKGAGSLINRAASATVSGVSSFYGDQSAQGDTDKTNNNNSLGISVLQALHTVLGGLTMATGTVLASSRDNMVDMIYKKYGQDAGYLAEKALGSPNNNVPDVLVYFDSNGIARQVLLGRPRASAGYIQDDMLSTNPPESLYATDEPPVLAEDSISQYTASEYQSSEISVPVHPLDPKFKYNKRMMAQHDSRRRSPAAETDEFTISAYKDAHDEEPKYIRI